VLIVVGLGGRDRQTISVGKRLPQGAMLAVVNDNLNGCSRRFGGVASGQASE
jgi:hypothetical protein